MAARSGILSALEVASPALGEAGFSYLSKHAQAKESVTA